MILNLIFKLILFSCKFFLNPTLDKKLGILFFKNSNYFSYNLFNFFYSINIAKKTNNTFVNNFIQNGFIPSVSISDVKIDEINNLLLKQNAYNDGSNRYQFDIDKDIQKKIKQIIIDYYSESIFEIEKYYNSPIAITNISIWRNYGFNESKSSEDKEYFSNYFHTDAYIGTFFKLFINLQDVNDKDGPLEINSIKDTALYIKKSNYKSRNNYSKIEHKKTYKNIGKKGESLFFNPTKCLHRASVPAFGNQRDMIGIIFNVVPVQKNNSLLFTFDKEDNDVIWKDDSLSKKYSKIFGFRNLLNFYNDLYKSRIVK